MSRPLIPYSVNDISALARSLRQQLESLDHLPGHAEMLNLLARAAGHRNFQSLRAAAEPACAPAPAPVPDAARLQRVLRHYDAGGRLLTWPARESLRALCLWTLWARLKPAQDYSESELNAQLRVFHAFEDHALLRRLLCDRGYLTRTPDGRRYRRVERRPTVDGRALIGLLSERWERRA